MLQLIYSKVAAKAEGKNITKIEGTMTEQTYKRTCEFLSCSRNPSVLSSRVVPLPSLLRTPGYRVVTGNTAAQHDHGRRSLFERSGDREGRVEFPG